MRLWRLAHSVVCESVFRNRRRCFVLFALAFLALSTPSALALTSAPPLPSGYYVAAQTSLGLVPAAGLDVQIQADCQHAGVSTVSFQAEGTVQDGPYQGGTFTEVGTATIGPQTDPGTIQSASGSGPLLSFESTFSIDSSSGEISGTKRLVSGSRGATCTNDPFPDGAAPSVVTWKRLVDVAATTFFDATITTTSGTTHVQGTSTAQVFDRAVSDGGNYYCNGTPPVECSMQQVYGSFDSAFWDPASVSLSLFQPDRPTSSYNQAMATVLDADGDPVDGVGVIFRISGVSGDYSPICYRTGGGFPGRCDMALSSPGTPGTDLVSACADTNGNSTVDSGEPCGGPVTATWVAVDPPDAQDDVGSVASGTSGGVADVNVLTNDTLGDGSPVSASDVLIFLEISSPRPGAHECYVCIDYGGDGSVYAKPGTPAGTYELFYGICVLPWETPCDYATAMVTVGPSGVADADSDGVADAIGTGNGGFNDGAGTHGSIVLPLPAGVTVSVADAPAPSGVAITVTGSSGQAAFNLCDWPSPISLDVGTFAFLRCGSVEVQQVLSGTVRIPLGQTATLTVPQGNSAEVSLNTNGSFVVSNVVGGGVTVTNGATTTPIPEGQPPVTIDVTPPVITANVAGTLGNNGWYRSNVSVTWTVVDGQSAVTSKTNCGPFSVTSNTSPAGVQRTCQATSAGGTASRQVVVKRDNTQPNVSWANHASSYTVDQTVSINCSASDAHSGIDVGCQPINAPAYTFALGQNTRSTSATDKAGNTRSVSTSFTVRVTSASLCNLTRQFVRGSAKYQTATSSQRSAVELAVTAACAALNARQTNVYKAAVTLLANNGWLTNSPPTTSQAATLRSLADRI